MKKITLSVVAMALMASTAMAEDANATQAVAAPVAEVKKATAKRTLKGDMTEVYNISPKESTDGVLGMLTQGQWYGRLRSNTFYWDWAADTDAAANKDHIITGMGGSFIYKTAKLSGLSFTAGAYYSYAMTDMNQTNAKYLKAGKDTVSRYNIKNSNNYNLFSIAQYYAQYDIAKTSIKVGQQLWDSVMTASNDTKMIPNTFMGASVESKDIAETKIRAFYFTAQKLRDHDTFHDFVTVGDGTTNTAASWNGNDDSGVNNSLTYAALTAAGLPTANHMNGADVTYTGIKDLKVTVTHNMVPSIVLHEVLDVNYKTKIAGMSVAPAFRVMGQKDLTGGKVAGAASLAAVSAKDTIGYTSANSMNGWLAMGRVAVGVTPAVNLQYGISYVGDMADIVAPWRAFPTGGYTRAMAQLNWNANTLSHMLQANVSLDKMGVLKGSSILARYAIQDTDDLKTGVMADTGVLHIDVSQKLDMLVEGLDAKFRLGMVGDGRTGTTLTSKKTAAYNEYRFEVNYLF